MEYISLQYLALVLVTLVAYHALPLAHRWKALLVASVSFYWFASLGNPLLFLGFCASVTVGYVGARVIPRLQGGKRSAVLIGSIALTLAPLVLSRAYELGVSSLLSRQPAGLLLPLGLSFYSLQIVAYLVDVSMCRVDPQRNLAKYLLFVSFFPQIVQGPIPRYGLLGGQLFEGHHFDYDRFAKGCMLVLWGLFLKMMVADKAAVVVDTIFTGWESYQGVYFWLAGALYGIQLYADFSSCVWLSLGVSSMFGITLQNNFDRPYASLSIKEFWRRWHISLSSWLRDYVYIPLGGNRKGIFRKELNTLITFFVSGLWHGGSLRFVAWGLLHGCYLVVEDISHMLALRLPQPVQTTIVERYRRGRLLRRGWTLARVWVGWVIFRAGSLVAALTMIGSMFTIWNPWALFDLSLFDLGLDWQEWVVLVASMAAMAAMSNVRQRIDVCARVMSLPVAQRWILLMVGILAIWVLGTYGYGFDAKDFIYGGF